MGRYERNKGVRVEREIVRKLRDMGIDAVRVPLSGSVKGFEGDVMVDGYKAEVKVRSRGFSKLYEWLNGVDILFLKQDRKPFLVIMPLEIFAEIWGCDDEHFEV